MKNTLYRVLSLENLVKTLVKGDQRIPCKKKNYEYRKSRFCGN
jgi:hypothetical protein